MSKVDWKKLKRKIPHRVQLGHTVHYEVVWADSFVDPHTMGETRFDSRQIVIKKGLTPKMTVVTFLHEVAHAYSYIYNLNLTETQVLNMEKGFYYLLKNGNIFK